MFIKNSYKIPPIAVPISLSDILSISKKVIFSSINDLENNFNKTICNKYKIQGIATFLSGSISLLSILEKIKTNNHRTKVILPAYTCPTVLIAIRKANLIPIFVDIELSTFCISINEIIKKIDNDVLAVIIPHMFGYLVNISQLIQHKKSKKLNFYIIEDFSQTFLSANMYNESRGDFGILSFGRAKIISTINGGAVITFNELQKETVNSLKNKSKGFGFILLIKVVIFSIAIKPQFYKFTYSYLSYKRKRDIYNLKSHNKLIYKDRSSLSSVQLALALLMLQKIDHFNSIRKENANYYFSLLNNISIYQPTNPNLYLRFALIFKDRRIKDFISTQLEKNGLILSTADYPVLSTVIGNDASKNDNNYPIASFVANNIINLPTHPGYHANLLQPLKEFDILT